MTIYVLFQNEEPISTLVDSPDLHTWYAALLLIASNLAYIPLIYYLYRVGSSFGASLVLFSATVSILYHTCQTTGYCFLRDILYWTMADHIFALTQLATIFLFTVNSPSKALCATWARMLKYDRTGLWRRPDTLLYDQWTGSVTAIYLGVVVMAVLSHPYSSQSYLIGVVFGLALLLIKILILERGELDVFAERLSIPDLVLGILLFLIALIFFALDGSIDYSISHFLWHLIGGPALFFYVCGISRHLPGAFSPWARFVSYCKAISV